VEEGTGTDSVRVTENGWRTEIQVTGLDSQCVEAFIVICERDSVNEDSSSVGQDSFEYLDANLVGQLGKEWRKMLSRWFPLLFEHMLQFTNWLVDGEAIAPTEFASLACKVHVGHAFVQG
jgi:hypothetical protein